MDKLWRKEENNKMHWEEFEIQINKRTLLMH